VVEIHDVLAMSGLLRPTVIVKSVETNPKPATVTYEPPDTAPLALSALLTTGASNVNELGETCVPTTVAIVIVLTTCASDCRVPAAFAEKQLTFVLDVHVTVLHATVVTCTDGVRSDGAKLKPVSVIETPRVSGAFFGKEADATGESNENEPDPPVPRTCAMVTVAPMDSDIPLDGLHCSVVAELHEVVRHSVVPTLALAVKSTSPKFKPEIVTAPPPLVGVFRGARKLATGASNDSASGFVPIRALTVTRKSMAEPTRPLAFEHCTVVIDDHEVVVQLALSSCTVGVDSCSRPKSRPLIVTTDVVDAGMLLAPAVITGASKVSIATTVPICALTVSNAGFRLVVYSSTPEPGTFSHLLR